MENEGRVNVHSWWQRVQEERKDVVDGVVEYLGTERDQVVESRPISRWRQQVIPEAPWEKDWREGEEVIFERRRHSRRVTRNGRR